MEFLIGLFIGLPLALIAIFYAFVTVSLLIAWIINIPGYIYNGIINTFKKG